MVLISGLLGGCGGCTTTPATRPGPIKTQANVTLIISCADAAFAKSLSARVAGWAGRTGATVRIEPKPLAEVADADLVVVRPADLGALAETGGLAPVPLELRSGGHPLQWSRIAPIYRSSLVRWGEHVVALPLAGDGLVLAYRADRVGDPDKRRAFAAEHKGRALEPPATWEDLADVAAFFAKGSPEPSLPPLPADPIRFLTEYHHLVACYDRRARSEGEKPSEEKSGAPDPATSFHVQSGTWQPRLSAPSFTAGAAWLARTRPYRPTTGADPVKALEGSAVVAVLSFAEVARLPKDATGAVDPRIRIAPLPGTQTYFDPAGQPHPAGRQGNSVPFVGAEARLGAVLERSPNAAAGWELLADLAGPSGSFAALSGTGIGPFRTEHVEEERRQLWLGYSFDSERTRELAAAARHTLGSGGAFPAIPLRTPDQSAVMAALEREVRRAATGQVPPEEALKRAAAEWQKLDAARTPAELLKWRRSAAGLRME